MTPIKKVYNAFLVKILDDEWAQWLWEEVHQDLKELYLSAAAWFKFPRNDISLTDDTHIAGDLDNSEIQILAVRMKVEWLNRSIMTWENIKPLYEERDFSQANMLDKLCSALEKEEKRANRLESTYYRSRDKKSFDYSKLAGG